MLSEEHPDIFRPCSHLRTYESLIERARNRELPPDIYVERHHIIPKSIKPNNVLVKLTAREHYIAHLLLYRCVQEKYRNKMLYAVTAMLIKTKNREHNLRFNSRLFASLREKASIEISRKLTGIKRSDETRAKIKEARKRQIFTEETRAKMSAKGKGRKLSPEQIEKSRKFHTGRKRSQETIDRLVECRKSYVKKHCEHCGIICVPANYARWHGDACKQRNINDVQQQNSNSISAPESPTDTV